MIEFSGHKRMPGEDEEKGVTACQNPSGANMAQKNIKCQVVPIWHKLGQRLVLCD